MQISVAGPSVVVQPGDRPLRNALGLLYVVASVGLCLYSLSLFAPYLQNDLFWSGFATLNTSAALRYVFNRALVSVNATSAATRLDVEALPWVEPHVMLPTYGRQLLYEHMTALPTAIASLRRLDSGLFTFLPAKYCWLDLERRWEMGVTTATQARCEAKDVANGAAYLEAVLRNMDFATWFAQNGLRFNMRVLTPLNASDAGIAWSTRLFAHTFLDVQREVDVWQAHGIAYFQLLYSNHYQVGVLETIAIENALGILSSFTIKSIPSVRRGTPSWTTALLTGNFEFELQGPGLNQSLVRHTPLFYGDIDPTQVEVYLLGPFRGRINDVVHAQIGMLNNLRLRWVPPPPDWIAAVQSFDAIVLSALQSNAAFARAYNAVSATMVLPPPPWTHAPTVYFGGNPMCVYGRPQSFVQESFSFDDVCSKQLPLTFTWTRQSSLFVVASGVDTSTLCSFDACSAYLASVATAAKLLGTVPVALPTSMVDSDVGIMQFAAPVDNESDISLDMQRLFAPAWRPHGVACAYDWVQNVREVVSFEGDVRTLQLMSAAYTATPTTFSPPSVSLGSYLLAMAAVVTSVLCLVAAAIVLLSLRRHRRHTPPWLQLHRLTASVYLNRGLMSSRALTAALCLASAVVEPVAHGAVMRLQAAPRPVWVSALLAAEILWMLYGGQELLHPLTPSSATLFPVVSALGFSSILLLDVLAPPTITATVSRSCLGIDMDVMLYCSSGHVQIGSFSRLLFLLFWIAVLLLVSTLSVAVVRWRRRHPILCIEESAYTVLPPLAVAHWPRGGIAIDDISAVLCGLLFVSKTHVFDTKLWLWLSPTTFEWHHHCLVLLPPTVAPTTIVVGATLIKPTPPRHWFKSKLASLSLLSGCLYIVATLGSNVAYLNLVRDNLANDFFWAGFNATGSYAFVANTINRRLLTNTSTQLALDATALIDYSQSYDESVASIAWPVTATSRALQDRSVLTLATAVRGLRAMDPCRLPWVFTQYCWLDVNQRWGMAHTQARQDRCKSQMASNAAVYLETALRNMNDWGRWHACYGDAFTTGFVDELQTSSDGIGFLTSLQSAMLLSVDDEVAYWRQAHLVRYELQWQNFKTTGFQDAMLVENALGLAYALPIANVVGRFHPTRQTSHVMYWALASDFWAVGASNASRIAGRSLLRSSSAFAFANISSEQLLVDNLTLSYPLSSGFHSLSTHVGPFNAVDMVIVPVPSPLLRYYAAFRDALGMLSAADHDAQARYVNLPTKYFVLAVPMVWQALPNGISTGGNILCGDDALSYPFVFGMGIGFGATSYCNSVYLEVMQPTASQVLFALSAFNATSTPPINADDYVDICRSDAIVDSSCVRDYGAGGAFLETYPSSLALAAEARAAYDAVVAQNVTTVQYGHQSGGSSSLLQLSLLGSVDRIWSFYGWMLLYQWTSGMREVVAFTGDAGVVTTITLGVVPVTMPPDAGSIPQTYAFYCQQIVLYITIVLIMMAIVVLGYTLHLRGHIEGLNLFEFNRTVGIVWVGRSFLFVRSITALCLLHTSTPKLSRVGLGTLLVSPPLHWIKIGLASSEATWLVYVLNDILSCVTQQYTPSYAYKSSLLTWSATFLWTLLDVPPSATANVSRACELVNMDDGLVCVSGHVQIGDVYRVYTTVGIALGCVFATYGIERMLQPQLRHRDVPSLLLNAQSVYCLLFREVHGAYYLDKASAALAGLLTLSQGDVWYILDVKTWRLLVARTRAHDDDAAALRHCLPLSQL